MNLVAHIQPIKTLATLFFLCNWNMNRHGHCFGGKNLTYLGEYPKYLHKRIFRISNVIRLLYLHYFCISYWCCKHVYTHTNTHTPLHIWHPTSPKYFKILSWLGSNRVIENEEFVVCVQKVQKDMPWISFQIVKSMHVFSCA